MSTSDVIADFAAYKDGVHSPNRPQYPFRERLDALIGAVDEGCVDFELYAVKGTSPAKVGQSGREFLDKLFGGQLKGRDVKALEGFLTTVQLALHGANAKADTIRTERT